MMVNAVMSLMNLLEGDGLILFFFRTFSHGWFGNAEESDVESEEETGVDLDNLDEDDEGESESEDDVPKAAAATFVAPALEVNLEDSQPRNDVEEEEDEESEDAKKVTKRAKKRQKEKR